MTMSIALRIDGRPVPKGSGEGTRQKRASYDHGVAGEWQQRLQLAFRRNRPREPWREGVQVDAVFYIPSELKRMPGAQMLTPPDLDKLIRFVLDEAKGHFYVDDAQVTTSGLLDKRWAVDDDPEAAPGVLLMFTDLGRALPLLPDWARGLRNAIPELTGTTAARRVS